MFLDCLSRSRWGENDPPEGLHYPAVLRPSTAGDPEVSVRVPHGLPRAVFHEHVVLNEHPSGDVGAGGRTIRQAAEYKVGIWGHLGGKGLLFRYRPEKLVFQHILEFSAR